MAINLFFQPNDRRSVRVFRQQLGIRPGMKGLVSRRTGRLLDRRGLIKTLPEPCATKRLFSADSSIAAASTSPPRCMRRPDCVWITGKDSAAGEALATAFARVKLRPRKAGGHQHSAPRDLPPAR